MRAARRLVAPILLAAAAGCALKSPPAPEETRKQALPNLAVPEVWSAEAATGAAAAGWLASFNDPELEAMVREALANNPDLGVAAARIEQAAGFVKASGATLYPQVSLMARGGGRMSGDSSGLEGAGVFATWELDLWGRVRAERQTARLQYDSTALDAEYARQSIAALVA
jgi:outer membrane protein TolC